MARYEQLKWLGWAGFGEAGLGVVRLGKVWQGLDANGVERIEDERTN